MNRYFSVYWLPFILIAVTLLALSFTADKPTELIAFIEALDEKQKEKTLHDFNDIYRERWHYLPTESWPRRGISIAQLSELQRTKLHALLQSSLSSSGYDKTMATIELENVLAELENNPERRNPEKYFINIWGDPSKDKLWSWRFEGHHVSLHFTNVDHEMSFSPRFFGANPGIVKSGSKKGLRSLAAEQDLGIELINSMNDKQKSKAIISDMAYYEIVTSNALEVAPLEENGLKISEMTTSQIGILSKIIEEYVSVIPEELAKKRMRTIKDENFEDIFFAWAGATEIGKAHYYRIQGKSFLLEFDNAQNNANHIHTIWRDFDGDFGRDMIREHRMNHKH